MTASPSVNTHNLKMITAMTLAGSIGIFVVESGQSASVVVFYRCLIGGMTLLLYGIARHRADFAKITVRSLILMAFSGVTMAANWVLFFMAYAHASISMVTTVYHIYPFALIVGAALIFHEKLSPRSICWAMVAFFGVALVAIGSGSAMSTTGLGLTLAAMVCYTATLLITKQLSATPAGLYSAVQLLVGAVVILPLVGADALAVDAGSANYLLIIGILHTAITYVLLYGAVQSLGSSRIAILSFLYPMTALVFDLTIYNVRPDLLQIAGICAIVLAVLGERLHPFRHLMHRHSNADRHGTQGR